MGNATSKSISLEQRLNGIAKERERLLATCTSEKEDGERKQAALTHLQEKCKQAEIVYAQVQNVWHSAEEQAAAKRRVDVLREDIASVETQLLHTQSKEIRAIELLGKVDSSRKTIDADAAQAAKELAD